MKAVALILALAVITGKCSPGFKIYQHHFFIGLVCVFIRALPCVPTTGCHARVVRQADATPSRWEDTVERFWQYVSELNQKADGVVQDLKASQLNRELE